jgi:hypothetical protein
MADMGTAMYQNLYMGGRYGGGSNVRPPLHEAAGLVEAAKIRPRNRDGTINDATGSIGFLTLGMSNAERTVLPFRQQFLADPQTNKKIKIIEACQYGQTADILADPESLYWEENVPRAVSASGLSTAQVQVAWCMEGMKLRMEPFPAHVDTLTAYWKSIVQITKQKYPNVFLFFLDQMQYMGYGNNTTPEPYYFEQGFALRTVILSQVAGSQDLQVGVVPWLDWGADYWSNGPTPSQNGMTWLCPQDCIQDGIHQSTVGAAKMASKLLAYLKGHPVAQSWFLV